jgi:hypothetical protein
VDGGIHTFSILDTFGDGICCQYGPGWYQIWYDDVLIHASDGNFGSEEIIRFTESGIVESPAPSTAESLAPTTAPSATNGPSLPPSTHGSIPVQTDSPIQSPAQFSVYGMYCQGVCPSGTLVNPSEIAQFSFGHDFFCETLDQHYQVLFLTHQACNQLALSAQEAGCQCTEPAITAAVFEESSKEDLENNPKFGISWWIYVSLAVLSLVGIICLVRRIMSLQLLAEEEAAQGDKASPTGSDLAGISLKRKDQSELSGRSYLQSWVLWSDASERDNQTVDETIFEDAPSAVHNA